MRLFLQLTGTQVAGRQNNNCFLSGVYVPLFVTCLSRFSRANAEEFVRGVPQPLQKQYGRAFKKLSKIRRRFAFKKLSKIFQRFAFKNFPAISCQNFSSDLLLKSFQNFSSDLLSKSFQNFFQRLAFKLFPAICFQNFERSEIAKI